MPYVNAMTDITGFGLIGHLVELCEGSNLTAEINTLNVPLLPNLKFYMDKFCVPDNTYRNWNAYEKKVLGIDAETFLTMNDPQTNGGLLISVDPGFENDFLNQVKGKNKTATEIGILKNNTNSWVVEIK